MLSILNKIKTLDVSCLVIPFPTSYKYNGTFELQTPRIQHAYKMVTEEIHNFDQRN